MTTPGSAIRVEHLRKSYVVHERAAGVVASLRSLVRRTNREVRAVDDISFSVASGEVVGFLGPNGAGKTTTLKMHKPVRQLSLGERMKCEVAASLLHRPQVLFLDEPTIGLDVTMQRRIRGFIAEYNRRHGATVLLTSHYMLDVEALCKRVIVIHHGQLLFDGNLADLVRRFAPHKTIVVELTGGMVDLSGFGEVVQAEDGRVTLRVPKAETARTTERLLASVPIADLTVEDPPIEEVIEQVFSGATAEPAGVTVPV